eukprot:CAMPEP_0202942298 /NCGR_PEP_ID=MMETSP1395-20130829/2454_1 /ASSEMBLY_ACC=CAM_ASM_000871 /TAXON_ID=5961 /ORGANISM="Blepharisma japonicum, Strain Stock R1072" /LENGTH=288 /DNA_ID=CAMNT_0049638353 /DNA_START=152 /DNA_END=1018 /DNA_ORIENTATION=+
MVTNFLQWEKPDFVAFTGDLITGYLWNGTADWFYDRWSPHAALLTKFGVPWGYALGNHDGEADLDRRQCVELDMTAPFSLSKTGPSYMGNSTFYVQVYDKFGKKPLWNLWFFDTGSQVCYGIPGWGCVSHEAVQWYTSNEKGLPGLAFMHIPLDEYLQMYNLQATAGFYEEIMACSSLNTGLFAAFKSKGMVKGVGCGHNHEIDLEGYFAGLYLAFGRKSGYGSYGPAPDMQRGVRMWVINEDSSFYTYIRQEDGSIMQRTINDLSNHTAIQDYCMWAQYNLQNYHIL